MYIILYYIIITCNLSTIVDICIFYRVVVLEKKNEKNRSRLIKNKIVIVIIIWACETFRENCAKSKWQTRAVPRTGG